MGLNKKRLEELCYHNDDTAYARGWNSALEYLIKHYYSPRPSSLLKVIEQPVKESIREIHIRLKPMIDRKLGEEVIVVH